MQTNAAEIELSKNSSQEQSYAPGTE